MAFRDHDPILRSNQLCHLKNICHALQLRSFLYSQSNVAVTKRSFLHLDGLLVHQAVAFLVLQAEVYTEQHGVFPHQRELLHQHRQEDSEGLPCLHLFDYLNPINFQHLFDPEVSPFRLRFHQNSS